MLGWIRRNKAMGQQDFESICKRLQKRIGYTFRNPELLKIALTHPSVTHEKKQRLEDLYRPHWESYLPGYEKKIAGAPDSVRKPAKRAMKAGTYLATHMHEVPLIAVFCYNPGIMTITDSDLDRPSVVGGGSVYPAVQNFLLACRNEGLGCVLTTLLCYEEAEVKPMLGLPERWYTCAHVPVGYPVKGGHGPISRNALEKMVCYNEWAD